MNILAIGAHWDDIELGCGLTLNRFSGLGHKIYCVILCLSDYIVGEHHSSPENQALEQGLKSFQLFGWQYLSTRKSESGKLSYDKDIMQQLENIAEKHDINTIFCHWFGDVNTDHQVAWQIARTAFRQVDNFLMYRSNAYTDHVTNFTPNYFQGFSAEEYDLKRKALCNYSCEWNYRHNRWEREIFECERLWGGLCKHDYAEGFMITKLVNSCL